MIYPVALHRMSLLFSSSLLPSINLFLLSFSLPSSLLPSFLLLLPPSVLFPNKHLALVVVIQSLSHVPVWCETPWTTAHQASLSFTNS